MKSNLAVGLAFAVGLALGAVGVAKLRPQVSRYAFLPIGGNVVGVYRLNTATGAIDVAFTTEKSGWKIYSVNEAARDPYAGIGTEEKTLQPARPTPKSSANP